MPVILAVTARVTDWQALQELNEEIFLARVRAIKASRYRIYRNPNDASQALLLIELLDPDDVHEIRQILIEHLATLAAVVLIDDRLWEPTGWESIDTLSKGG